MNGIGLLVLIAAAGQIAAAQTSGPNRDFGWERDPQNPDRALCYIIQLSPEKVADMQHKAMENPSDMPPELVGRATRILVRVGTEILPQTPSLEELRNMPRVNSPADVTAQLGEGRLSEVEPSDLLNVQQRGSPALPSFPGQSSATSPAAAPPASGLAMPRTNFGDAAPQESTNPIDQAKQLDRSAPAFPNPRGPAPGSTNSTLPNYAGSGNTPLDRAGTASNGTIPPNNASDWRPPATTEAPRNRDEVTRTADNRFQNQNSGNLGANYPQSTLPPNYSPQTPPSLDSSTMTSTPNRPGPNIGFGANPGGQGKFGLSTPGYDNYSGQWQGGQNGPNNAGYGGQYGGGQYGSGQYGVANPQRPNGPGGLDGYDRVATLPPASREPENGPQNAQQLPPKTPPQDASAREFTLTGSAPGSKTSENILSVFFLFSLVVNFYLGMLIRKLLTRYRALLANMRGQTSPNAFSS